MPAGSTVNFLNGDTIKHNVMSPDNERFDLGNARGGDMLSYTFNNPGVYTILCRVHPEMISYVVVVNTPYFATAMEDLFNIAWKNMDKT